MGDLRFFEKEKENEMYIVGAHFARTDGRAINGKGFTLKGSAGRGMYKKKKKEERRRREGWVLFREEYRTNEKRKIKGEKKGGRVVGSEEEEENNR